MDTLMRTIFNFGLGGLLATICILSFDISIFNGVWAIICSVALFISIIYLYEV